MCSHKLVSFVRSPSRLSCEKSSDTGKFKEQDWEQGSSRFACLWATGLHKEVRGNCRWPMCCCNHVIEVFNVCFLWRRIRCLYYNAWGIMTSLVVFWHLERTRRGKDSHETHMLDRNQVLTTNQVTWTREFHNFGKIGNYNHGKK